MNALRNKVQLIGRLGKDAEMITFDDGKVKARFRVATNESFRNGERVERPVARRRLGRSGGSGWSILEKGR